MTHKTPRELLIVVSTWIVLSTATVFAGVTDSSVKTPSSYGSMQPPAKGATYVDAAFGTTVKRLTDATHSPDHVTGGNQTWNLVEYATMSQWNNDNSRLLLQNDSYYGIYDGNGTYLKDAAFEMNASTEPRWSRTDNNVVYFKRGNQLKSYNVATDAVAVVHSFSEYSTISGNGESDISWDGDHMVMVGDGRDVFVYTFSTNTKGTVFPTGGRSFDSVYIAADNKVTITWNQVGTARYQGIELFDQNMTFLRQVARSGGHMDMSRDVDGTPVLVWTNANDPQAICNNGIVKIRLSDGQQTCLAGLQLDWSLAVHITGSDQGWVAVSTYAPSDPAPGGNWPAYTNEVFRIKLDGSVVERLAHHRSQPRNSYNYQAWASYSRDGSRIIYSSNFNLQSVLGYPTEYADVYMISLNGGAATATPTTAPRATATATTPATSTTAPRATATATSMATSTARPTPTTAPATSHVEQTDAAVKLTGSWQTHAGSSQSAGSAALAMGNDADATLTFSGTGITWRGVADAWSGQADVYLDGTLKVTVDTYSANERDQAALYTVNGLAAGTHTLRIHVRGTQNASSGGPWVWVDAFDIVGTSSVSTATPTATSAPTTRPTATATATATFRPTATATARPTATATTAPTATATTRPTATATTAPRPTAPPTVKRLQETSSAIQYTGVWFNNGASVLSGSGGKLSMDVGAQARVTFTGTGIKWIGYRDPWSGIGRVLLDGVLLKVVDTYAAVDQAQSVIYSVSGLTPGTHTLAVEATGTHGAGSAGSWIWVDAFDVVS